MKSKELSIPSLRPKTRATAEAWSKKGHSYKPLPIRFRRDGFDYRQIAREGDAAIYPAGLTLTSSRNYAFVKPVETNWNPNAVEAVEAVTLNVYSV